MAAFTGSVALAGAGTLTLAGKLNAAGAISPAGAGTLTGVGGTPTNLTGSGTLTAARGGPVNMTGEGQLVAFNTGTERAGVLFNYLNVGVKRTPDPDAVLYNYLNVTNAPSTVFISDSVNWIGLQTQTQADQSAANTLESAKNYTNKMIHDIQGEAPPGGNTGQALTKMSNADYDYSWVTPSGGGGGSLPTGGSAGQVLRKNSGLDGDASWTADRVPAGGTTGQVLKKTSGSDYAVSWQDDATQANKDRRWNCPSTWISIDEFNDEAKDSNWIQIDKGGTNTRVTWTEKGDVMSLLHTGGDANAELHGLMRPISSAGGTMQPGNAFVTCLTLFGRYATNYTMGGLVLSDNATWGAGNQIITLNFLGSGTAGQTNDIRGFTNWSTQGTVASSIQTSGGVPTFVRLVRLDVTTWRADISNDGVSWLTGPSTLSSSITPTYVGLLASTWSGTVAGTTTYEFLRRQTSIT